MERRLTRFKDWSLTPNHPRGNGHPSLQNWYVAPTVLLSKGFHHRDDDNFTHFQQMAFHAKVEFRVVTVEKADVEWCSRIILVHPSHSNWMCDAYDAVNDYPNLADSPLYRRVVGVE